MTRAAAQPGPADTVQVVRILQKYMKPRCSHVSFPMIIVKIRVFLSVDFPLKRPSSPILVKGWPDGPRTWKGVAQFFNLWPDLPMRGACPEPGESLEILVGSLWAMLFLPEMVQKKLHYHHIMDSIDDSMILTTKHASKYIHVLFLAYHMY